MTHPCHELDIPDIDNHLIASLIEAVGLGLWVGNCWEYDLSQSSSAGAWNELDTVKLRFLIFSQLCTSKVLKGKYVNGHFWKLYIKMQ